MWQLVLLIIASSKCSALSTRDTREMLVDFIQISDTPFVTTHVCWDSGDGMTLVNSLIKMNKRVMHSSASLKYEESITENKMMYVVDMSCKDTSVYLENANKNGYFEKPFKWILLDSKYESSLPAELNNLMILPNSEVVIARRTGDSAFILNLIYRIKMDKDWIVENFAEWTDSTRLIRNPRTLDAPLSRRTNLAGINLTTSSVISVNDTIEHLEDMQQIEIDTLTKSSYAMVSTVLEFVNAKKVKKFADTWGYYRNGSYFGMVRDLMLKKADIGASPMFITEDRLNVIDYIGRPIETSLAFVFQRPNLSFDNNIFLLSFRYTVWLSLGILLVLSVVVLFIVSFWEWKRNSYDEAMSQGQTDILKANFSDVVLLVVGAACQQGSHVELKGPLGRTVLFILFLMLMFLYTSYSANIVALLQSTSNKIQNLEDLHNSKIQCAVEDTLYNRHYFTAASDPVRKAFYNKKISSSGRNPKFISLEEGVKKVQQGSFAFHMLCGVGYKLINRYFHESEKCKLKEVKFLHSTHTYVSVAKKSPYIRLLKMGFSTAFSTPLALSMRRIQEHGLQSRLYLLFYESKPRCARAGGTFVSVTMAACVPALLVLAYGLVAAVALCVVERAVCRRAGGRRGNGFG